MRHQMKLTLASLGIVFGALAASSSEGQLLPAPNASEITSAPDITPEQRGLRDRAYRQERPRISKASVIAEASAQLQALHIACNIRDAALVAEVPAAPGVRSAKTFEVACDNGVGYFATSAEQGDAFSCFAAEAAALKDIEQKRTPGTVCTLPANRDVKAMAEAILGKAGSKCSVSNVRWIGINAKAGSEFTEVKCADGSGYVLVTAAPGSGADPSALSCVDASKRGLQCSLTKVATPATSLGMLTDALAARKITCTTDANNIRVVGQETVKKRYVVEFKCPEHPTGLVAFIPLGNATGEFEALDCADAKKRNVMCSLK